MITIKCLCRRLNYELSSIKFVRRFLEKRELRRMDVLLERELRLIEEQPVVPAIPKFNSDCSEFEWNGIVYKIPQKYYGMPVNEETMKKIATEIIEEQEILARIAQAELDIYERFEQNDDDFLNDE